MVGRDRNGDGRVDRLALDDSLLAVVRRASFDLTATFELVTGAAEACDFGVEGIETRP